ncbi:MAG: DUF4153 domain-containing protein [Bacteroidota bacterium]
MKKAGLITVFVFSVLFTFLFYKHSAGLNLLLFETAVFGMLLITKKNKLKNPNSIYVFSGTLLSVILVVINNSVLSIVVNLISFYVLTGILIYPEARSLLSSFQLATHNIFSSTVYFFKEIFTYGGKSLKFWNKIIKLRIIIIPLIIIVVFIILYHLSNPVFEKYLNITGTHISNILDKIFSGINVELIFIYIFGLAVSIFIFMRVRNERIISYDINTDDILQRVRRPKNLRNLQMAPLVNELSAGVFMLFVLNVLILFLNIIDIYWVWFNFEWNGQYLKQFVHEGTYLLIISILISIAIILFFFRGNLNFYRKNKLLKILSYAWLGQNCILAASVAIRNFWYIHYFSLAYGRIGVLFFLLLTLFGIYTVIIKIRRKKSSFYLFRTNCLALYLLLILMAAFNWDNIIARYNFSHYKSAFIHYNFLSTLSDKALSYLDKSMDDLKEIDKIQKTLFPFEEKYMNINNYYDAVQKRKNVFLKKWESKDILEWNYAEYRAYQELKKNK